MARLYTKVGKTATLVFSAEVGIQKGFVLTPAEAGVSEASSYMDGVIGILPGGFVDDTGGVHRLVEVAPLTGREEEMLSSASSETFASKVTLLLSRCVRRIGDVNPVTDETVRSLLVADRLYLLLKLREATFGDRVQATIGCGNRDCAARIDIDFSIKDVPIVESVDKGPVFSMELSPEAAFEGADGKPCRKIAFRLPNGGDQEALVSLLSEKEALAAETLLSRCVVAMGTANNPGLQGIRRLPTAARMEIERRMEESAPLVELIMEGECPECSSEFSTPFDIHDFLFQELRTSLRALYREVHYLAYHYHWSEREIMEMPRAKRRRYIEVLSDEIERLNDAVLR